MAELTFPNMPDQSNALTVFFAYASNNLQNRREFIIVLNRLTLVTVQKQHYFNCLSLSIWCESQNSLFNTAAMQDYQLWCKTVHHVLIDFLTKMRYLYCVLCLCRFVRTLLNCLVSHALEKNIILNGRFTRLPDMPGLTRCL